MPPRYVLDSQVEPSLPPQTLEPIGEVLGEHVLIDQFSRITVRYILEIPGRYVIEFAGFLANPQQLGPQPIFVLLLHGLEELCPHERAPARQLAIRPAQTFTWA